MGFVTIHLERYSIQTFQRQSVKTLEKPRSYKVLKLFSSVSYIGSTPDTLRNATSDGVT